jgi:hypothetical protein
MNQQAFKFDAKLITIGLYRSAQDVKCKYPKSMEEVGER